MAKNGTFTPYDDEGYPINPVFTAPLSMSSLTSQALKGAPGRLAKVTVNTALSGSGGTLVFYDNASAASGTPLLTLNPTNGSQGAVFAVDLPFFNGLYVTNPSGTLTAGQVTVGYS